VHLEDVGRSVDGRRQERDVRDLFRERHAFEEIA
jgi:hypothetical protein